MDKIKEEPKTFANLIEKIRKNGLEGIDIEDINNEVEITRANRFKGNDKTV